MSKLLSYALGLVLLVLVGGFAFFALSPVQIEQNEVVKTVPADTLD